MSQLVDRINSQLVSQKLEPLNEDQIECLRDRSRLDEAAGMLDDLHARCGVRLPLPDGLVVGTFTGEEEARAEAEDRAKAFDAVCIDELATDDSRSFGGNEYRVIGFSGRDAALAAVCFGSIASWIDGTEHTAKEE